MSARRGMQPAGLERHKQATACNSGTSITRTVILFARDGCNAELLHAHLYRQPALPTTAGHTDSLRGQAFHPHSLSHNHNAELQPKRLSVYAAGSVVR